LLVSKVVARQNEIKIEQISIRYWLHRCVDSPRQPLLLSEQTVCILLFFIYLLNSSIICFYATISGELKIVRSPQERSHNPKLAL